MADIQHSDAVKALDVLRDMLLKDSGARMTYSDLCVALGRDPTREGRYIGQVASRIDAACFYADLPFLATDRVRRTNDGSVNEASLDGPLWGPHRDRLFEIASSHLWTEDDFKKVAIRLRDLGDNSAKAIWERIESRGEIAVVRALAAGNRRKPE